MDWLLLLQAVIMGLVEGITEFLPISSTGHLIITADLLNFWTKEKREIFEVAIQLGAILAVCYQYREKISTVMQGMWTPGVQQKFVINVAIAFLPAAILGFFFIKTIKTYLFNPQAVAIALIVGGFIILWVEKRHTPVKVNDVDDLSWKDALKVGLFQSLALIPGTSRSGATIIGGLVSGLSRKTAAEFSFFLAIPTMFVATAYDVLKHRELFVRADFPVFAVGFVVSFISALLVIRAFMGFISKHDFSVFAWYRIIFGSLILLSASLNWIHWS